MLLIFASSSWQPARCLRGKTPHMRLSEEEKMAAYREAVARAGRLEQDPSLRPQPKPLFEVPKGKQPGFWEQGGFLEAVTKAKDGWQAAVAKQQAANQGAPVVERSEDADQGLTSRAENEEVPDGRDARLAALEEEVRRLQDELKRDSEER